MRKLLLASTGLLMAACASSSGEIATAYVSPIAYQHYQCDQIAAELQRVSLRTQQLAASIDQNAEGDAVAMGVGLVLFWPALFFIDGDGPEAQEYARLKGEYEALHQAGVQNNCGFTYQPLVPPQPEATEASAEPRKRWNTDK